PAVIPTTTIVPTSTSPIRSNKLVLLLMSFPPNQKTHGSSLIPRCGLGNVGGPRTRERHRLPRMSRGMMHSPLFWVPFLKKKAQAKRLCLGQEDGPFALSTGNSVYSKTP